MTEKRVTKEQLLAELGGDIDEMLEKMADAINNARAGAIIAESEEPVRDAHARLRIRAYQKALNLLDERAFSPSKDSSPDEMG